MNTRNILIVIGIIILLILILNWNKIFGSKITPGGLGLNTGTGTGTGTGTTTPRTATDTGRVNRSVTRTGRVNAPNRSGYVARENGYTITCKDGSEWNCTGLSLDECLKLSCGSVASA